MVNNGSAESKIVEALGAEIDRLNCTVEKLQKQNQTLSDGVMFYRMVCEEHSEDVVKANESFARLNAEIDRLNRIMPHVAETCKHSRTKENFGEAFICSVDKKYLCYENDICMNAKWEVKD